MKTDPRLATLEHPNLPEANLTLKIPGLTPCTTTADPTININSEEPVILIVHGCYGSAARFRSLAEVFAFHGQQTVCFNYNDRDSMLKSSTELVDAILALNSQMKNHDLTIVGHSQGGLIARKALIKEREDNLEQQPMDLRLVTISSPYAGIAAANHCASTTARIVSLGLVIPICKLISGDKWFEITHASDFIQEPGNLLEQVISHVKIVTDERGSCRNYNSEGNCIEDDYVFSLDEQYYKLVDKPDVVNNLEVVAGHAEIVGDVEVPPLKLIDTLQRSGIMHTTEAHRRSQLDALLTLLY